MSIGLFGKKYSDYKKKMKIENNSSNLLNLSSSPSIDDK
jgi:hypothetical protein